MPRLLNRRAFLLTGAAVGGTALVAAVGGVGFLAAVDVDGLVGSLDGDVAALNAFVTIHQNGRVVVNVPKTEMGQGIHTGLAMVVAEELDIPFDDRIEVVFPTEAHPAYSNWFNVLQVRPEEAASSVVWIGRRVLGQLGFIAQRDSRRDRPAYPLPATCRHRNHRRAAHPHRDAPRAKLSRTALWDGPSSRQHPPEGSLRCSS